jgi:tRNA U34 5-methylaminomethyl-2-thiouridine-forming methyltransferase MnmC
MTLFSEEFDEPYHSDRDGALNESLQKHVKPAIALQKDKQTLTILDICFGLGYNTFATLYYIKTLNQKRKIHIISPEFDKALIESLKNFRYPPEFDFLKTIIQELSQNYRYKDDQLHIEILVGDARELLPQIETKFDIIYQDAFSPTHNPLLWTREYFAELRSLIKDDGVLTTYSTAAAVRMGLDENDFKLFSYKGEKIRESMVASPQMLELEFIDMELKKIRNPNAKSMRDEEYIKEHNVTSQLS